MEGRDLRNPKIGRVALRTQEVRVRIARIRIEADLFSSEDLMDAIDRSRLMILGGSGLRDEGQPRHTLVTVALRIPNYM